MRSAASISLTMRSSQRHHVAGIAWPKILTYAVWIALALTPVFIAMHHEAQAAQKTAALDMELEREMTAKNAAVHAAEKAMGHKAGEGQ